MPPALTNWTKLYLLPTRVPLLSWSYTESMMLVGPPPTQKKLAIIASPRCGLLSGRLNPLPRSVVGGCCAPTDPVFRSRAIPVAAVVANRGPPSPGPRDSLQPAATSAAVRSPERPTSVVRLYMIPPPLGVSRTALGRLFASSGPALGNVAAREDRAQRCSNAAAGAPQVMGAARRSA